MGQTYNYDVVIVGAGMSGLSTALHLVESAHAAGRSPPRIAVLEAEDTPGGRVKAIVKENGAVMNLGAHWAHGGESNPFFQEMKRRYPDLSFTEDRVENLRGIFNSQSFGANFRQDNESDFYIAYQIFKADHPGKDTSLAALADGIGTDKAKAYARFMAQLWVAVDDPAQVSATEFFEDPSSPGGMQVRGGNGVLIDKIINDLKVWGVDVITSCPVRAITQKEGVSNIACDGNRQFNAKQVVTTVSVGVLKSGLIAFDPPHSVEITSFLDRMSMGQMAKISIPLNADYLDEKGILPDTHIDIARNGKAPVLCHVRTAGEPVLTLFTGGSMAEKVEIMTPREIEFFVNETLADVPYLSDYVRAVGGSMEVTRWGQNPFFGGAYSAVLPGSDARVDPIRQGSLIISGEALVADPDQGPSALQGAWSAGRVAARMVSEALRPAPPVSQSRPADPFFT